MLGLLARVLFVRTARRSPDTVLVLRNCFVGDYIVAVPALRALRKAAPGARIVLVTAASFASSWRDGKRDPRVFSFEPGLVDEVIEFDANVLRSLQAIRELRARVAAHAPEAAVHLGYSGDSLRSRVKRMLFLRAIGVRLRPFGFGVGALHPLPGLNRLRRARPDIAHQATIAYMGAAELCRWIGTRVPPLDWPVRRAQRPAPRRIGLAPFTKQPLKQWPIERFAAVVVRLSERFDCRFEIYGAEHEAPLAAQLIAAVGTARIESFCGRVGLDELSERVRGLELMLCLDSGPMHAACLHGVPVVAVFPGITLPQYWAPWSEGSAMLTAEIACAPCNDTSGRCPRGHARCVQDVDVEPVLAAMIERLSRSPAPVEAAAC